MIGRRIPVPEGGHHISEALADMQPGDYCGPYVGATGDKPAVYFLKPNARDPDAHPYARSVQHVTSPPHVFTEMPDGSLEIKESISDRRKAWPAEPNPPSDGWHGFLDAGHVWRRV